MATETRPGSWLHPPARPTGRSDLPPGEDRERRDDGRAGFTLAEVLISALVLSVFLGGAFMLFRSGANSFTGGHWRAQEQKKLQIFLEEFGRDLEQASGRIVKLLADGSQVGWDNTPGGTVTPIYLNNQVFSSNGVPRQLSMDAPAWTCLALFNVTRPYKADNATFGTPLERGRWTGISLWAQRRKLRYVRSNHPTSFTSGQPTTLPGGIVPPHPAVVAMGADFEPGQENIKDRTVDCTFETLSITASATPVVALEVRARVSRRQYGVPETTLEEAVTVKLASGTTVQGF